LPRASDEAIKRNRDASRNRYHANRDQSLKVARERRDRKFEERPFIGWDSEGYDVFQVTSGGEVSKLPQRTMLFGCSVPGEYIVGMDLSTLEMLALVTRVENLYPDAFHVIFSGEYDFNQMLKDLPWNKLAVLKLTTRTRHQGYKITHVPHKMLTVSRDGISATIYDCFGFFHCSYTTALDKYDIGTLEKRQRIARGKQRRGHFTWAEIEEVIAYWKDEISLLPDLLGVVRECAYAAGFRVSAWHGPGALATYALRANRVSDYMSKDNIPARVQACIRTAYAGGRFQAWRCGWYHGPIFTLDKNSAYVQAIAELPDLSNGKWVKIDASKIRSPGDIARFGVYRILFDDRDTARSAGHRTRGVPEQPYPLFHRNKNGGLTWPSSVVGWYWSPEARIVAGDMRASFMEGYEYRDDGTRPFSWVNDSYEARLWLQQQQNPAEKAFKWALAAYYGSFARRVGWNRKNKTAPRSHELAWAGYITSHCRAAIYDVAAYAHSKGGLISVDTDGVTATVPFPEHLVPEGFGSGLGQWKQDSYAGILFWQNGIYWLLAKACWDKFCANYQGSTSDCEHVWKEAKSRGVPKGRIPVEVAQDALDQANFRPPYKPATITIEKTRYIGYRQALNGQFDRWRKWVTEPYEIIFGGTGKGAHFPPFCRACRSIDDKHAFMHTITHLPPRDMESAEHKLPWLEPEAELVMGLGSDFFAGEDEIFGDDDLEDRLS
jgi:hypothetical protein